MQLCIKYACELAATLSDGTLTSVNFQDNELINTAAPIRIPSMGCGVVHIDIELDCMTLINVPIGLLKEVHEDAHCV